MKTGTHAEVEKNMWVVKKLASYFYHKNIGFEFEDLVQYGTEGLLSAIAAHDPSKGVKLSTYAYTAVKRAIIQAIRREGYLVRPPSTVFSGPQECSPTRVALCLSESDDRGVVGEQEESDAPDIRRIIRLAECVSTKREWEVFCAVYATGLTYAKTGALLGLRKQTVGAKIKNLLGKIRKGLRIT